MAILNALELAFGNNIGRAAVGATVGAGYSLANQSGDSPNVNLSNLASSMTRGALAGAAIIPALKATPSLLTKAPSFLATTTSAGLGTTIALGNNLGTIGIVGGIGYAGYKLSSLGNSDKSQLDSATLDTNINQSAVFESEQLGGGTISAVPNVNRYSNQNFQASASGLVHGLHRRRHG
jgi:hypothetical protein